MSGAEPAPAACSGPGHVIAVPLATCSGTVSDRVDDFESQKTADLRWNRDRLLPFNVRFPEGRHVAGGQRGFPDDRERSGGSQDQFDMQHAALDVPMQTGNDTAASALGQLGEQETRRFSSRLAIPHELSFPLLNMTVPPRLKGGSCGRRPRESEIATAP